MNKLFAVGSFVVAGLVFAEAKSGDAANGADVKLACPADTKQVGGRKSSLMASVCVKTGRDGSRVFHGPYVAYWNSGVKQAEGQFDNGWRAGAWSFFDEKGVKTGDVGFNQGDYDGVRVEFHDNGQKKLVENYVKGRRQGMQTMYDVSGKVLSTTNFVDDRPVTASNQ